eukprot:2786298-Rhodomonas_salina.5
MRRGDSSNGLESAGGEARVLRQGWACVVFDCVRTGFPKRSTNVRSYSKCHLAGNKSLRRCTSWCSSESWRGPGVGRWWLQLGGATGGAEAPRSASTALPSEATRRWQSAVASSWRGEGEVATRTFRTELRTARCQRAASAGLGLAHLDSHPAPARPIHRCSALCISKVSAPGQLGTGWGNDAA